MIQVGETLGHVQPPPIQDHKRWAMDIVAAWDANQYKWQHGYRLACEALGITPASRSPVRKPEHRAYIEDQPFIDPGHPVQECDSSADRFTHPYQQQDF
ncbi:hypothetical protein [Ferrovum sp.]|uniref:hypothetical protein n=1 Tax=Ferrovum sp. TaxID=2609467 RepID=UPI00260B7049|nr:hypothetical protein [Ferrovum sp.]